jgi:penicillin-binding protein 2
MEGAVSGRYGTASRARVAGLSVAGKTGTAQNPHGEDHAVFVCFAPVEAPQVAIAIIVENGGEGGLTAAPIAQKMLEYLFKDAS